MLKDGSLGKMTDLAAEKITIMMGAADRLSELVEDLLNVSRIEQGRLSINLAPLDIVPIIEGVIDEMSVQADLKNLRFIYEKPEEALPQLLVDPKRLKQILVNIIGNSIKYTPQGSISVTSVYKPDEKLVEIKVADTGLGMSAKDREKLFSKFYRVKIKETEGITGTGLGLWITKQLVELMSGEILVDSIVDVGTQMTINFPVKSEKEMRDLLAKQDVRIKKEAQKIKDKTAAKAKEREAE